jgi:hypothetical protein
MPESWNRGVIFQVTNCKFAWQQLVTSLEKNSETVVATQRLGELPLPHQRKVVSMTMDKLNPLIRCPLFSSRRTVLRGWLTELTWRKKEVLLYMVTPGM